MQNKMNKMTGYIILNAQGQRLNDIRVWDDDGWIWSGPEIREIVRTCKWWTLKPHAIQKAKLEEDGSIHTIENPILLAV